MTIEELRIIVSDIRTKAHELARVSNDLRSFIDGVYMQIAETNPLSGAINVDALVSLQTPIYMAHLQSVETASDALGTDAFSADVPGGDVLG